MNEFPCPVCGHPCDYTCDCPGYLNDEGQLMVCQGCCNATLWTCTNCAWWYREPNYRSSFGLGRKMGLRPSWMRHIFIFDED